MTYKLVKNRMTEEIDVVNKIMDGRILSIPMVDDNTDYQEYLKWVAEGNTPEEAK